MAMRPGRAPEDRARALPLLVVDLALPLVLYYGLRLLGADAWVALLAGAGASLIALLIGAVLRRGVERAALFSLTLIAVGTAVGLLAADARLLMARGGWVTVVVGIWLLGSLLAERPVLFRATERMMPPSSVPAWRREWQQDPGFRALLRRMTLAFGVAFLVDAAARVLMAYTLPLDLVPLLSSLLLVAVLAAIVLAGRSAARRRGRRGSPPAGPGDRGREA